MVTAASCIKFNYTCNNAKEVYQYADNNLLKNVGLLLFTRLKVRKLSLEMIAGFYKWNI